MEGYTSLEQSKKLAEILPLDSADMSYRPYREEGGIPDYQATLCPHIFASWIGIPCWSLAALLEVISYPTLSQEYNGKWSCMEFPGDEEVEGCENPVDACYEIILSLNEQKLL